MAENTSTTFLDEEAVSGFKKLYAKEYGIELTSQEAVEYASRLILLVSAVYGNDLPKLDKESAKG